jgi:hypothetical protein
VNIFTEYFYGIFLQNIFTEIPPLAGINLNPLKKSMPKKLLLPSITQRSMVSDYSVNLTSIN